jgi:hypothetical protein
MDTSITTAAANAPGTSLLGAGASPYACAAGTGPAPQPTSTSRSDAIARMLSGSSSGTGAFGAISSNSPAGLVSAFSGYVQQVFAQIANWMQSLGQGQAPLQSPVAQGGAPPAISGDTTVEPAWRWRQD